MPLCEVYTLTPEIEALLSRAMYPDPDRIARTLDEYQADNSRQIFVWKQGEQVVSAAGIKREEAKAEILHIGSNPALSGRGYARALIHDLLKLLQLENLYAETDDGAVAFYRKAGFEIHELPSKWDTKRYYCVLSQVAL